MGSEGKGGREVFESGGRWRKEYKSGRSVDRRREGSNGVDQQGQKKWQIAKGLITGE